MTAQEAPAPPRSATSEDRGTAPARGGNTSLSGRALSGLVWSGLGYASQGVGQLVVLAVLGRYVTAEDFGVASATLLIIGIGKLFTQSVVGPAVVQRATLERRHLVTAGWLALASGVFMTAVIALLAPVGERLFRFDGLALVMVVLSLSFVLQAPSVVPEALMQREFAFRRLAISDVVSFLFGYCLIGVVLAVQGAGVWALVFANLAQVALRTVILVWVRRAPLAGRPELGAAREIVHYGTGFTAGKVFNYAAGQGDYFVIGRTMSATALGYYSRAYQLVAMPAQFLGQVLDRVLFPVLASVQHDRARMAEAYRQGISLICTIMAPLSALIVVLAPEIVHVVLGRGWEPVVTPFQVLALGLVCRTGYKISDSLARSVGTVYKRAWRQGVYAGVVVGGALVGGRWGINGVAWGVLLAIVLNYLVMSGLSIDTTGLSWGRFLVAHLRGVVLATVGVAVCWPAAQFLRGAGAPDLVVLVVASAALAAVLGVALLAAPTFVLGGDGLWLVKKVRTMRGPRR